jgi:hypothetical protein
MAGSVEEQHRYVRRLIESAESLLRKAEESSDPSISSEAVSSVSEPIIFSK